MKKLILFLFTLIAPLSLFAQTDSKLNQANIDQATRKTGVLLKREYRFVDSFYGMDYTAIKVEDVISKVKYSGVRIEYSVKGKKESVFIDSDELKVLIKSVELIRDKRLDPVQNIDYKFICRGGFVLEFGFSKQQWGVFIVVGEGLDKESVFIYEIVDVLNLINILNNAS